MGIHTIVILRVDEVIPSTFHLSPPTFLQEGLCAGEPMEDSLPRLDCTSSAGRESAAFGFIVSSSCCWLARLFIIPFAHLFHAVE